MLRQWAEIAREDQLPPNLNEDWDIWLNLGGRGSGKTRAGAEAVNNYAKAGAFRRIALVGQTAGDWQAVMLNGDSGIIACSDPTFRPEFKASKRSYLQWPNGTTAWFYSGDRPDQLRGPQHDFAWFDEFAKFQYPRACWENFVFGWRIGEHPRAIISTTPRPLRILREIAKGIHGRVHLTQTSSHANLPNLAPSYRRIVERYEGTRLGRQEIHGHILDESPTALWHREWFDTLRIPTIAEWYRRITIGAIQPARIVIGVDPAVTSKRNSDETGIITLALMSDGHIHILDDSSGRYRPEEWAAHVYRLFNNFHADCVVGEINNGGELVAATLHAYCAPRGLVLPFHAVHASKGKYTRAEPIAVYYERGMAHHVGAFDELEDQMCVFEPAQVERDRDALDPDSAGEEVLSASPDRVDALVWAATELLLDPVESRAQVYYEDTVQISPY